MSTTEVLAPPPKLRFVDSSGNALNGGKLFTYSAGTTTKLATYTDNTGATANANPVILDTRGEAGVWIPPGVAYKFTLSPSTDTDPPTNPIWTVDQITNGVTGLTYFADGAINVGSPTGADKGAGTINVAVNYFVNGTPGSLYFTSTAQTVSVAGSFTLAHSLAAEPAWVFGELQCQTAELGYAIGAHVQINPGPSGSANRGISFSKGPMWLTIRYGSDANVIDLVRADTGATAGITPANWKLVVKARA